MFMRKHTYLRVSLTEKCNFRCLYCMPEEGIPLKPNDQMLTDAEILRLVHLFARHGVDKIRLTGGEPTIRKNIVKIVEQIASVEGIKDIGMTTNGLVLHRMLPDFLDTLDKRKFALLTRRDGFDKVWRSINTAINYLPKVKLNVVVMNGKNEKEVVDFIALTKDKNLDIRFIEFMPFGGNHFERDQFYSYRDMLMSILEKYGDDVVKITDSPNDTTKAYKIKRFQGQFGFITSMSDHFCNTCNRLRITADGHLKVCLHGNTEVNLRDKLRAGDTDDVLSDIIQAAVNRKKAKHAGMDALKNMPNQLTHVDSNGNARQVDVSDKSPTIRIAIAKGTIALTPEVSQQITNNCIKKGDVLTVAKIASIIGAKQVPNIIPLCHSIHLDFIDTVFKHDINNHLLHATSTVKCFEKTGVEMEAITAVSIALLTVYDMCKAITQNMVIRDIRLVHKSGGKTTFNAT
ncbi:unnamed protein product [Caenorhabditis bovis]|uniref:Radical SAM core domain-containing protein n=1 Tax=Caenorhabditis bovis TaxID=2654633 RepID=A0A8S1EMI0_9PELO|nr:unnamed protein product [Caenorhabditis bovis]